MQKSTLYLLHLLVPTMFSLFVFMYKGEIVDGHYSNGDVFGGNGAYYITALSYSLSFLIFSLNRLMNGEKRGEEGVEEQTSP